MSTTYLYYVYLLKKLWNQECKRYERILKNRKKKMRYAKISKKCHDRKMYEMYDISLLMGCQISPDLEDLREHVPAFADPALLARIEQRSSAPDFLGLNLPENVAVELLQRLLAAGALGQRVLSAYRQPSMTVEQAAIIAEQAIAKQQRIQFPHQSFSPVHLASEQPMYWSFKALSPRHVLFAMVDKLDGHLWQQEDIRHLHDEADQLRLRVLETKTTLAALPITHWRKRFDVYDLYLLAGCRIRPDFADLVARIPILVDPLFQARILHHSPEPGFLGLDLPEEIALRLLQRLKSGDARGYRLPAAYRQPLVTLEQASNIAQAAFAEQQKTTRSRTLGPVRFLWARAMLWVFGAVWDPPVDTEGGGMIYARVDKLDGHLWTPEELHLVAQEENTHI